MSLRARGVPLLLVLLAACPARTRRVGVVSGPPEPPSLPVRPLEAADLARNPARGMVLGAGGPGRARSVRLLGRHHWLSVAAPLADGEQAARWGSFWLIARPKGALPAASSIPAGKPSATRGRRQGAQRGRPRPRPIEPPSGPALDRPSWKRALWLARLAATQVVGKSPLDLELDAVSRGAEVEPPGAATLAVATIAALTGARIGSATVVIAELEPDGSLAPVDRSYDRVREALRRGARRIVLPTGGTLVLPAGIKQPIDLVRLVRRAGVAVGVAPDLAQAYGLLTGTRLPEPEPVAEPDLSLAKQERAALRAAYRRALERIAPAWPNLIEQQNRPRPPPPLAALVAAAERGARRAERWRATGHEVAGYLLLSEAAAMADAAMRLDQIVRLVGEGDIDGARSELDKARTAPDAARLEPPGESAPATIGEHVRAGGLFALAANSWAWSEEAGDRARKARSALASMADSDRDELATRAAGRKVAEGVAPLLIASARARLYADLVQDRAAFDAGGRGPRFVADPDGLREIAAADAAAAKAALEDLDQLASAEPGTDPSATVPDEESRSDEGSKSDEDSKSDAESKSSEADVVAALRLPDAVATRRLLALVDSDGDLARGSGRARVPAERSPLLALAVARHVFARAGDSLARARRLRPELNPWTGQVRRLARPSRLRVALSLAERAARSQAASARVAIGSIPLGARLAFEAAQALARGEPAERVMALELYQAASAECRLAILLALSEDAPTSAIGSAAARAGCPPSPSARRTCR